TGRLARFNPLFIPSFRCRILRIVIHFRTNPFLDMRQMHWRLHVMRAHSAFLLLILLAPYTLADTIIANSTTYSNVIVRESGSRYYVAKPANGKAFSVAKSDVDSTSVMIQPGAERDALQQQWEDRAGYSHKDAAKQRAAIDQSAAGQADTKPKVLTAPPDP